MTNSFTMTEEQARASDPHINAFVAASAGTGKTHVLVTRIIRLLVLGSKPSELICLTFTKAAAAEMKTRLYKALGQWTRLSDDALTKVLWRDYALRADQDMLIRARQLFAETLDLAEQLRLQTFHSFCQSLLGRFPLEAGLVPGFRAAEDAEAQIAKRQGRDQALYQGLHDPSFQEPLRLLAERSTENTFESLMDALQKDRDLLADSFAAYGGASGYLAAFRTALGLDDKSPAEIAKAGLEACPADGTALRQMIDALLDIKGAWNERTAASLQAFLDQASAPPLDRFSILQKRFITGKGTLTTQIMTKPVRQAFPDAAENLDRLADWVIDLHLQLIRRTLYDQSRALILIGALQMQAYESIKATKGLVDFTDMVDRTVSLMADREITQWILYKLDQEVGHILVDEAQDTNPDQWQVVSALADEFFAGEGAHSESEKEGRSLPRTVFAVGDEKQSIFSFQGARPEEFVAARQALTEKAETSRAIAETVPMNKSFRSGRAVLDLVDQVFVSDHRAAKGVLFDQASLHHDTSREGMGGLIELWPLEKNDELDTPEPWDLPIKQDHRNTAEDRLAMRVASHIHGLLERGEVLAATGQPIQPGDIMVLVRRRKDFTDQLSRYLQMLGVAVAGRDRMALTNELPVMDLIALARSALLPEDDLTLAAVLKGPFIDLREDQLFDLCHNRGSASLFSRFAAADDKTIKAAYERYGTLIRDAERVDCAPFFYRVLEELGGRADLRARLGEVSDDPINAFVEQAEAFDAQESGGLLAFLQHVERAGDDIKRDLENADSAVRIMTVHSAKGLQAPLVYLADTTSLPDTGRDGRLLPWYADTENQGQSRVPFLLWTTDIKGLETIDILKDQLKQAQLAEYRRLLYVALTRAEDRLYICGHEGSNALSDDCWYKAVERGMDRLDGVETKDNGIRRYLIDQTEPPKPKDRVVADTSAYVTPAWVHQRPKDDEKPLKPLRATEAPVFDKAHTLKESLFPLDAAPKTDDQPSPLQLGVILHKLLEWLPNLPPQARIETAKDYLFNQLPDAMAQRQLDRILALLEKPEMTALFSDQGKSEVSLAGKVGDYEISGRLDRLVVLDTEIVFADYKTGDTVPQSLQAVPDGVKIQMARYRSILRKIYPDRPIKALLIYTATATVLPLPETELAAFD